MVQSTQAATAPADEGFCTGLEDFARQLHWERLLRTVFLPEALFGEPAWDLLLQLYGSADGLGARKAAPDAVRALVSRGLLAVAEGADTERRLALTAEARTKIGRLLQEIWFNRASPDPGPPPHAADLAARPGRIDAVIATLSVCQDELDSLQLWQPGADVSQAIEVLKCARAAAAHAEGDALSAGYP